MPEIKINKIPGGVTAPQGFSAAGVAAKIKNDTKDVALVFSDRAAAAAGVFTTNKVKAAPLYLTMENINKGEARAVVVNSGNANACNGPQGLLDAKAMAGKVSALLQIPAEQVLVGSTGVIGQPLPMTKVLAGIEAAASALSRDGGPAAAEAIMTTDTFAKEIAVTVQLGDVDIIIGGMAKGSGMIHPNMATMLGFITTDAAIEPQWLKKALAGVVDRTFNMITVDGDTSTNDMVLALANGAAGNPVIDGEGPAFDVFCTAMEEVCRQLAIAIARDGEGATKLLEVRVRGANSSEDAKKIAKSVAGSSLVKAAVFGQDANWGRIICAAGYSGADFDPDQVDIFIGAVKVASNGAALPFDEEQAAAELAEQQVLFEIDLKGGNCSATAWGCDLTYDYVRINGSYRT